MFRTRRIRVALGAVLTAFALAAGAWAQANPYRTVDNFFRMPDGRKVGSTAGITIDRDGTHIWVFERCGGNYCTESAVAPILEFDPSGTVVRSFGAGMFIRPHGIHIDRDGNVWVSDGEGPDGCGCTTTAMRLASGCSPPRGATGWPAATAGSCTGWTSGSCSPRTGGGLRCRSDSSGTPGRRPPYERPEGDSRQCPRRRRRSGPTARGTGRR